MNYQELGLDLKIYDVKYWPFWQDHFFYLLCFLAFLIFILLVYFIIRSKKNKKVSPEKNIFDKLNQLNNLINENNKEFYSKLIGIFKDYLFIKYNHQIRGMTDTELIEFLEQNNIDKNLLGIIKEIIDSAIFFRFSNNGELTKIKMQNDLEKIINIIRENNILLRD